MGIKITTDDYGIKVWRSDKYGFPQYSIIIGKTESGKSEYKQVQFRHGVELENGDEIYIDNAFPTMRTWKDRQSGEERSREVWMITEFSYRARYEEREQAKPKTETQTQMQMTSQLDDLPDSFSAAEDDIPFRP